MKDERWILAKIKEKAEELGLSFNRRIFIANWVTKNEANIISYLTPSPKYDKFGKTKQQRANNLGRFLRSRELREMDAKGLVVNKKSILDAIRMINDPLHRKMIEKLANKFKFNSQGYAPVVSRSEAGLEDSYDVLFHEWIHALLNHNKLGFYDTGGNRWKYSEGLTIFVEYYLGNYYGFDTGVLKGRYELVKKHGEKTSYDKLLKYFDIFAKLLENEKTPTGRKEILVHYFRDFPAPRRTKF
ncbi:MAG: hypothetical protein M1528_01315 [Candidatus Marsarchaeota archaeon]|nr:hypothetical protein [Candidatus Marsarchaeota archaeon]MCL5115157.1 hypothetical protein [Candidatus Marsarchaeota archaeon]